MNERMDRSQFQVSTYVELDKQDKEYWAKSSITERLETITFLRECFYGPEATTGRLQRLYQVLKLE